MLFWAAFLPFSKKKQGKEDQGMFNTNRQLRVSNRNFKSQGYVSDSNRAFLDRQRFSIWIARFRQSKPWQLPSIPVHLHKHAPTTPAPKKIRDAAFLLTVGSFLLTVKLFYSQLTSLASLLTIGAFFAYSFSFFTYSWSFSAYSGKMHLIRALRDCTQGSLTVSKKAPTVSKKAYP